MVTNEIGKKQHFSVHHNIALWQFFATLDSSRGEAAIPPLPVKITCIHTKQKKTPPSCNNGISQYIVSTKFNTSIISFQISHIYLDATMTMDQHEQWVLWRASGQNWSDGVCLARTENPRTDSRNVAAIMSSSTGRIQLNHDAELLLITLTHAFNSWIATDTKSFLGQVLVRLKLLSWLFLRAAPLFLYTIRRFAMLGGVTRGPPSLLGLYFVVHTQTEEQ